MTLRDVVASINSFDAEHTIYSEGRTSDSAAVVDAESGDGSIPATAAGMEYLIEVSLARDAIRVWSEWRNGRTPSIDEMLAAVVHYADYDAFLPVTA